MSNVFKVGQRVRVIGSAFTTPRRDTVAEIDNAFHGFAGRVVYWLTRGGVFSAHELADDEPRRALPVAGFNCSRTCPAFERVDVCRFNALLAAVGVRAVVNSHTVKVAVAFSNVDALRAAVAELGGRWIGRGSHKLFERDNVAGHAFTLPRWNYPLVATFDGQLAYDDFNGRWGNVADVDRLRAAYAVNAAATAAAGLGWMHERNADGGLTIYHPNGGTLTIDRTGNVDANGFNGVGCHSAAGAIASAIGRPVEFTAKPEYYAAEQQLTAGQ